MATFTNLPVWVLNRVLALGVTIEDYFDREFDTDVTAYGWQFRFANGYCLMLDKLRRWHPEDDLWTGSVYPATAVTEEYDGFASDCLDHEDVLHLCEQVAALPPLKRIHIRVPLKRTRDA